MTTTTGEVRYHPITVSKRTPKAAHIRMPDGRVECLELEKIRFDETGTAMFVPEDVAAELPSPPGPLRRTHCGFQMNLRPPVGDSGRWEGTAIVQRKRRYRAGYDHHHVTASTT